MTEFLAMSAGRRFEVLQDTIAKGKQPAREVPAIQGRGDCIPVPGVGVLFGLVQGFRVL